MPCLGQRLYLGRGSNDPPLALAAPNNCTATAEIVVPLPGFGTNNEAAISKVERVSRPGCRALPGRV